MDKQKEKKKKVLMPFGLRNKLIAAISMLLVSSIMMVSSTYAWFTLSTAPEVKNISTTVAGNGSLEIALMPSDGTLGSIKNGRSTEGTVALTTANTSWGNLIDLSDESYGLKDISLNPASLKMKENSAEQLDDKTKPLSIANYGMDGRITTLDNSKIFVTGMNTDSKKFTSNVEHPYGVRAIGEVVGADQNLGSSYGYVIDLALRLNTSNDNGVAGKLLLQTEKANRIYDGSTNEETMGSGSTMSFSVPVDAGLKAGALKELLGAIRITFVQNYGNSGITDDTMIKVLGTAKLDTSELHDYTNGKDAANAKTTEGSDKWTVTTEGTAPIFLYKTVTEGETTKEVKLDGTTEELKAVLLTEMPKNAAQQISAIVWLDGNAVKNGNVSATAAQSLTGTLNLQFSTDIKLNPAVNTPLKGE